MLYLALVQEAVRVFPSTRSQEHKGTHTMYQHRYIYVCVYIYIYVYLVYILKSIVDYQVHCCICALVLYTWKYIHTDHDKITRAQGYQHNVSTYIYSKYSWLLLYMRSGFVYLIIHIHHGVMCKKTDFFLIYLCTTPHFFVPCYTIQNKYSYEWKSRCKYRIGVCILAVHRTGMILHEVRLRVYDMADFFMAECFVPAFFFWRSREQMNITTTLDGNIRTAWPSYFHV